MKRLFWVALAVLVVLVGMYLLHQPAWPVAPAPAPNTASAPSVLSGSNSNGSAGHPQPAIGVPAVPSPGANFTGDLSARAGVMAPAVADTNAPQTPDAILESMRRVIRGYQAEFGENPVGNNAEITAALMGNNPRHINFIQPDTGLRVNGQGELMDAWGTPFFFHQLSGQNMEIHSAGPDRIMWTSDDLVTH